ncbi:hypothetical protein BD414DRAFT_487756 [Trametes punicea]|nr:hypothetical protein BD414DRAFT_487756 [Trametes punicea]
MRQQGPRRRWSSAGSSSCGRVTRTDRTPPSHSSTFATTDSAVSSARCPTALNRLCCEVRQPSSRTCV